MQTGPWLTSDHFHDRKYIFHYKNNGIYECSLKHGIDDKNIKNVALAGAYGSGKSSILKTFEKKYKNKYEFLNISLADFSGSEKNSENLDIERSILQKMFYTVKSEEIPFSRFKRIKDITSQELKDYSKWLFIGLFCFFIAYKNKNLPEYLSFLKFDIFANEVAGIPTRIFFQIILVILFRIIPLTGRHHFCHHWLFPRATFLDTSDHSLRSISLLR